MIKKTTKEKSRLDQATFGIGVKSPFQESIPASGAGGTRKKFTPPRRFSHNKDLRPMEKPQKQLQNMQISCPELSGPLQAECLMQRPHAQFNVFLLDNHRNLDF